jgi:hypothetical protein
MLHITVTSAGAHTNQRKAGRSRAADGRRWVYEVLGRRVGEMTAAAGALAVKIGNAIWTQFGPNDVRLSDPPRR